MSEQHSNRGSFRLRRGKLLFIRFGPVSAQRQRHNRRPLDMRTLEPRHWDGNYSSYERLTPVNRGIWVFPYPFHDPFFYYHVFERQLPRRFRDPRVVEDMSYEEAQQFWKDRDCRLEGIRKSFRPSYIWWDKPFYSHIRPKGFPEQNWYLWTDASDWVEAARKRLHTWDRWGDSLYKVRYSADHLECFLPMKAHSGHPTTRQR